METESRSIERALQPILVAAQVFAIWPIQEKRIFYALELLYSIATIGAFAFLVATDIYHSGKSGQAFLHFCKKSFFVIFLFSTSNLFQLSLMHILHDFFSTATACGQFASGS